MYYQQHCIGRKLTIQEQHRSVAIQTRCGSSCRERRVITPCPDISTVAVSGIRLVRRLETARGRSGAEIEVISSS